MDLKGRLYLLEVRYPGRVVSSCSANASSRVYRCHSDGSAGGYVHRHEHCLFSIQIFCCLYPHRFTTSDYYFGIFQLFLSEWYHIYVILIYTTHTSYLTSYQSICLLWRPWYSMISWIVTTLVLNDIMDCDDLDVHSLTSIVILWFIYFSFSWVTMITITLSMFT
jgi:hypothetical protein